MDLLSNPNPASLLVAASMGGSLTSEAMDLRGARGYALQFIWTGTSPVGSAVVQGTNVQTPAEADWADVWSGNVTGNSGNILTNHRGSNFTKVRGKYTRDSGTGSLTIVGQLKK